MPQSREELLIGHLPKAELHVHLEGTLEPELMFELAARNQIDVGFASADEVRLAYRFANLQEFLDIYYRGAQCLRTAHDFADLTRAYLARCRADRVVHTEIFFDPQTHSERGVEFSTVIEGILEALTEQSDISYHLIPCILRHLSETSAFEMLEQALPYKRHLVALGLDSSERGHPPEKFARVFARARQEGFLTVAHAGEEGPPEYIIQALDLLQVKRIDHGVRAVEDAALLRRLAEQRIPLTVCPLSNVALKVFPRLRDHVLPQLMAAGVAVTINSDDPAYFGGYLNENFRQTYEALLLSAADLVALAKQSFAASFLPEDRKADWIAEIDDLVRVGC